jgi:hypothetical protein
MGSEIVEEQENNWNYSKIDAPPSHIESRSKYTRLSNALTEKTSFCQKYNVVGAILIVVAVLACAASMPL